MKVLRICGSGTKVVEARYNINFCRKLAFSMNDSFDVYNIMKLILSKTGFAG
jgi:hypothetical protein